MKSYDIITFRVEVDAFFDADLNCDENEQEELPDEPGDYIILNENRTSVGKIFKIF